MRKPEKHRDQNTEIELSDCLPRCLDWRLLLFMTPMLRATDRIRDTVRQMSALALCSRHECCWHTHQRRGWGGSKRERNGVSKEEMARERRGEKRKQRGKGKQEGGASLPSEIRHRTKQTSSVGQDLFCHVSVREQPVWSERDTTGLDKPQAVTLTLTDPGEEVETSCALLQHQCSFLKICSAQAGRLLRTE